MRGVVKVLCQLLPDKPVDERARKIAAPHHDEAERIPFNAAPVILVTLAVAIIHLNGIVAIPDFPKPRFDDVVFDCEEIAPARFERHRHDVAVFLAVSRLGTAVIFGGGERRRGGVRFVEQRTVGNEASGEKAGAGAKTGETRKAEHRALQ